MATRVPDAQMDGNTSLTCLREGLFRPGPPVDRVVGVLEEIGGRLMGQSVRHVPILPDGPGQPQDGHLSYGHARRYHPSPSAHDGLQPRVVPRAVSLRTRSDDAMGEDGRDSSSLFLKAHLAGLPALSHRLRQPHMLWSFGK